MQCPSCGKETNVIWADRVTAELVCIYCSVLEQENENQG